MPSAEPTGLSARGLERVFGRRRALAGVDLALQAGEAVAVFGPNGAGKTTLLRVLAGLMRPTAGEVWMHGRRVSPSDPESRRPIGFLSHHAMLYGDLTARENLMFAARLYGLADPGGTAVAALAQLDLADRVDDTVRTMSRGLVQRVALARALLHGPSVLLLDEPFTGLDTASADRLSDLLRARREAGSAMVLVTHHLAEAWDLVTRVAVLFRGRWVLEETRAGTADAFRPKYRELIRG